MISNDLNNYMKAIKHKKETIKNIPMISSERNTSMNNQQKRCFACKKDLRPFYSKTVRDFKTKELRILCADCTIKTVKRN